MYKYIAAIMIFEFPPKSVIDHRIQEERKIWQKEFKNKLEGLKNMIIMLRGDFKAMVEEKQSLANMIDQSLVIKAEKFRMKEDALLELTNIQVTKQLNDEKRRNQCFIVEEIREKKYKYDKETHLLKLDMDFCKNNVENYSYAIFSEPKTEKTRQIQNELNELNEKFELAKLAYENKKNQPEICELNKEYEAQLVIQLKLTEDQLTFDRALYSAKSKYNDANDEYIKANEAKETALSEFNKLTDSCEKLKSEIETIQKRIDCCEKKISNGYYGKNQHCLCASYGYCGK